MIKTAIALLIITPYLLADNGMLRIVTDPTDAMLFVNGARKGNSPAEAGQTFAIQLPEGEYEVSATKADGETNELYTTKKGVFVANDTMQTLTLKLDGRRLTPEGRKIIAQKEAPFAARYTRDSAKQTVTDTTTHLMWQDNESIEKPWVTRANYDAKRYDDTSGNTAHTYCKNLTLGDYTDWRLPTIKELETLVYCSSGKQRPIKWKKDGTLASVGDETQDGRCEGEFARPTITQSIFTHAKDSVYWSSTTGASYTHAAWIVHFSDGGDYCYSKDASLYVRCVRSGQ